jgi:hypothetical protein
MERSRRDVLRASGALLSTAGVAGCIEERVTRRETRVTDTSSWTLSPATDDTALDAQKFENHVERMADRYGDSGIWGLGTERPGSLESAHVQRYAITRSTPGDPTNSEFSLVPESVEPEAPVLIGDACLARYAVGEDRFRYWLWVAADPTDDRLVRDVRLRTLSTGIRLRNGSLTDAASPTVAGGEATIGIGTPPSGSYPVRGGSFDTTTVRGASGTYVTEWTGELDEVQSTAGVCEVDRSGPHEHVWTMSLGYSVAETA